MPSAFRIGRRVATASLVSATLILLVIATLASRSSNSSRQNLPIKSQSKNFKQEPSNKKPDERKLFSVSFEGSAAQHLKAAESFMFGDSDRANQYASRIAKVPELELFRTLADESQTGDARGEERDDDAEVIFQRIRWFKARHPEPEPESRLKMIREEYQQRELKKRQLTEGRETEVATSWTSLGPTNGGGRVSSIAVHPTAIGTVYVGADSGGVWRTTDGGNTWTNLTDSINNLNVGAIAIAPSAPNIIYVGTGSEHSSGIGLLKSTDGGNTWQFPPNVVASRFWRISVHPTIPLELVAATDSGCFRSTDGGQSWSRVLVTNATDVKRDPSNPLVLYATGTTSGLVGGVVFKSVNGGISWVQKTNGLPTNSDVMSIAVTPSNPQVLYICTSIQGSISHVYKSTDGGETWNDLPGVFANPLFSVSHVLGNQAWHDNAIVVSPFNPNVVIAAGVFAIRSTDGGLTWGVPSLSLIPALNCETSVHADTTDLQYQGPTLYFSGDGGLYSTSNDGQTAVSRNTGLVIRQYYSMSNASPILRNMFLAGAQDNGTDRRPGAGGTSWTNLVGSDSFNCAINSVTGSTAYATSFGGSIYRTRQAGTVDLCFLEDGNIGPQLPPGEAAPFFTRLIMDFANPSILYTLTYRVWRTTDGGNSWAPLPTTTTDGSTWVAPNLFAVSRSNNNVLMTSTSAGVFRSENGGITWTKKTLGQVFSLEIDPRDPNTAYAGANGAVFVTNDGGTNWTPRDNGLPSAGVLVVRVDPLNSNNVYCGTYNGVFSSTDRGLHWSQLGSGLPSVYVEDLRITDDGTLLRAATYGRGTWEFQLRPTFPIGISGRITDNSGNAISNVTLTLRIDGSPVTLTQTDSAGNYSFLDLATARNYFVTPSRLSYVFSPASMSFNNLISNQVANFMGSSATPATTLQFTQSAYTVGEASGFLTVTVTRSDSASAGVSVNYGTSDEAGLAGCNVTNGRASERCDYETTAGTLRFAAGEASKSFIIPVINDALIENNETFTVSLSGPSGAILGSPATATVTIVDDDTVAATQNPIDGPQFFITQQYLDFLGRLPDPIGLANWLATLNGCPNGGFGENDHPECDRVHISAGFFLSTEFQVRGYWAYKFYEVGFNRRPNYTEFVPDMAFVGGPQSPESEALNKAAYTDAFAQRSEFIVRYNGLSNTDYVNALEQNAEVTISNKADLIADLNANRKTRAQVLREIVENPAVDSRFFIPAFVAMQYFGYLRRDPDTTGYNNWVTTLTADPGNYRHMIFGFLYSNEYRLRFGP